MYRFDTGIRSSSEIYIIRMTSLAKTRKDFNVAFSSLKFQPFSMLAHRQLSKTENIGRTIFNRGYYVLSLKAM